MKHVQDSLSARKRPRKQFSPLWRPCEARASQFKYQERTRKQFHHCGGPVMLVKACLCA